MYNAQEAAEKIGVKLNTIRLYCRQGKIDFINEGNRYMFTAEAIHKFNESKKNRRKGAK